MTKKAGPEDDVFHGLGLDHIEFHVADVITALPALVDGLGLTPYAGTGAGPEQATRSVAVGDGSIRLVLTEAVQQDESAGSYVAAHGDGVAVIGLRVRDARAAFATATSRGARPVAAPVDHDGVVTASVVAFGDVLHTFVERPPGTDPRALPGLVPLPEVLPRPVQVAGLHSVDHLAVCLEAGQLDRTVEFYQDVLGFTVMFEEHIAVGAQAMNSKVVASFSGEVVLTLLEPDPAGEPGQLDQFLKNHNGAGVQHIALATDDVVTSVRSMRRRGAEFLGTPGAYYDALAKRLTLARHTIAELRELDLLVDEDHNGQLFQIFCRSTHPRKTFFFEVIERAGANTFGSANIKSLYAAVEQERLRHRDAV
ncbi:4-hydroxyphenylpyruvate dioxygenase [Kitasatospora sp. MMS16-BH015]|uniref:4-hydroxyphenylpyruvate dioxygenase n=1 Tax=Kitasatospora sp. MMS16-BH015 TaxID=2018025 RepID=UPI000CA1BA32|nr:4-hydroxyphenylpyruvate dioxygenase [Kitasatospora sp. MMS16-BH015]AUG76125.1 4-hydroxyphenylpyruvate dioxygenase [Kitasatospora sp. MMS16-BH015]